MKNYLVRALTKKSGIRGLACLTTGVVLEVAQRHQASPAATAALGYGLTGVAMLGALLKVQQRVGLKVEGDGPLGKMVAESDSYGHLRGYIERPDVAAPPIDAERVADLIGRKGQLTVIKDLQLKDLYESVVPLQTGRLDVDLTYYLITSEQVPSIVEISAPVDADGVLRVAGGLLLQLMPGGDLEQLRQMAERLDDLPPFGELLSNDETPQSILAALFSPYDDYDVLEVRELQFRCECSWERSRQALEVLSAQELEELLAEGEAVIECHFCRERYRFDRSEIQALLDEKAKSN